MVQPIAKQTGAKKGRFQVLTTLLYCDEGWITRTVDLAVEFRLRDLSLRVGIPMGTLRNQLDVLAGVGYLTVIYKHQGEIRLRLRLPGATPAGERKWMYGADAPPKNLRPFKPKPSPRIS